MEFKPTIGIEMHAELISNSKAFSTSKNTFTRHPNTHVTPLDLALPGTLPQVNKEIVRKGIMMASILNCNIPNYLVFDRKNYYYPDLPKGYQITQSSYPIGTNGHITVPYKDGYLDVLIHDIHIEEDSARLEHLETETLIDYNRAGIPLLELVTEPTFHNKDEVIAFLEYIRLVYQYMDISEANIKRGEIRCDVNISLSNNDSLGTKVEIKNVGSFTNIAKVIDIEIKRQQELLENNRGNEIIQETRRFDEEHNQTIRMRSKADAIDYKYFIDPNIPMIRISDEFINEVRNSITELPIDKQKRYLDFGLSLNDANLIIRDKDLAIYYDNLVALDKEPIISANFLLTNILAYLKEEEIGIKDFPIKEEDLAILIKQISEKKMSNKQAKDIYNTALKNKISIAEAIKSADKEINDQDEIRNIAQKLINDNPTKVEEYKNGRTNLFNFFVGGVMKETKGLANPVITKDIISSLLDN